MKVLVACEDFSEYMVRGFEGDRAAHRSKTFPGIARAMAEQWG